MQETYSISVIVPSYNRKSTIKRCIDSIIVQTYPIFEIIIVDDGSDDGTLEFIEKEYKSDKRIQIIKQNHKGAQAARNAGIRTAQGEYIAFLDSDDEWLPSKLEVQVEELKKNADAVICGNGYVQTDWEDDMPKVYSVNRKNGHFKTGERKLYRVNGKTGKVYKHMLCNSFCLFQLLLTSKKNLLDIGLLDEKVASFQEWDTAIRLAKEHEFIFIKKPLFIYHLHDGETISKSQKKSIDGLEYIYRKFQYEIAEQYGSRELTQRYKTLMIMCVKYRDIRVIKYFIKYILGQMNVFILR